MTIIWETPEAVEAARKAVMARNQETGFDPGELQARLGIKADFANYRLLDA